MTDELDRWKMKKLIKSLQNAKGNGTSMISLIIPPKDTISSINTLLAGEYGTASNIKSRVNKQSVLGAITSAQQRLKLYSKIPENGLVLYTGTIIDNEGKDKKVTIDFEPFKPLNTSLYLCDNKFHTEPLNCLLDNENVFGFIIVDGNGCLIATLSGNKKTILRKFTVELPGKTRRGGQSANRFARLREDARRNYIRKVSENANELFITNNEKVNVKGIIIAGSADLKNDLTISEVFDERIKKSIIAVVDISYGQLNGLNQAIELSSNSLLNLKFIKEKKLLQEYFEEISFDTRKYCYGLKDTIKCLTELNLIETLIIYEELDTEIYIKDNEITDKKEEGAMAILLSEWLCENYTKFGIRLEFVSDSTQEGSQFLKGFGGIGGILRYASPSNLIENEYEDEDW